MSENDILTSEQAAELIGIAEQTLRKWRSDGTKGPPYEKLYREVRYSRAAVLAFKESNKVYPRKRRG